MSTSKRPRGETTQAPTHKAGAAGDRTSDIERRSIGARVAGQLRGALVDNAPIKFVALVLSLTIFILVHSEEQKIAGAQIDVTYSLPRDRVMVSERVDQVRITVKGSRRAIRRFHKHDIEPVHIDLTDAQSGQMFFQKDMFDLPDGVELVSYTPDSMAINFEPRVEKSVPVVVDTSGAPGRGYRVESVTADPASVQISGAEGLLSEVESIRTAEVPVQDRTKGFTASARLVAPSGIDIDGRELVHVQVELGEDHSSRELQMKVALRAGRGVSEAEVTKLAVEPDTVTVVLRGTVLALDKVNPDQLSAIVRVAPDDVGRGQPRPAEVRVIPPLPGVAYEVTPSEVSLQTGP